ncbi:hypothetical protein ACHAO8_007771 [Botrytis cinerea]
MEVPMTMAHHGPLTPGKIQSQSKQKVTHSPQNYLPQPRGKIFSIFSSQYIPGYNVMNPDEYPRTGPLVMERECPAGLNCKDRRRWNHQKKYFTKLTEWLGFSKDEENSVEAAADDESQEVDFIGFSGGIDEEPFGIPRIKKRRTTKDTSSEVEDFGEVTGHQRLTGVRGVPFSPVVEPVLSLVEKDSSRDQKLRVRSAPMTSKSKASRYAHLKTRASSLGTLSIRSNNVRLRLRVQRQQKRSNSSSHRATPPKPSQGNTRRPNADKSSSKDASTQTILSHSSVASILQEKRLKNLQKMAEKACSQCLNLIYNIRIKIEGGCGIPTSSNVAHFNPTLATAFQSSTVGSCAMSAASPSKILPAKPMAPFPAVGQPPSADMSAVASSTRTLLIGSSLSVSLSSTINIGVALDGRLGSKFPAEVQFVNPITVTILKMPVDPPAFTSNTPMQVEPHFLVDETINKIIDADNLSMFNTLGHDPCPRAKLLELQRMYLHHLDLTYLAIVSGDLKLSNYPDLELGGLDLLVEDGIHLD